MAFLVLIVEEGGRRQAAVLHVTGKLDGVEDLLVTGAAADVSAKAFLDFLAIGEWICSKRRRRGHHNAGDAIAALARARLMEGFLQNAKLAGLCERLDCFYRFPLRLGERHEAGFHQNAVDEHRACAAFAGATAFLVAGQVEVVADEIKQALMWLGIARDPATIDYGAELKVRHRPPPVRAQALSGPRQHLERR